METIKICMFLLIALMIQVPFINGEHEKLLDAKSESEQHGIISQEEILSREKRQAFHPNYYRRYPIPIIIGGGFGGRGFGGRGFGGRGFGGRGFGGRGFGGGRGIGGFGGGRGGRG